MIKRHLIFAALFFLQLYTKAQTTVESPVEDTVISTTSDDEPVNDEDTASYGAFPHDVKGDTVIGLRNFTLSADSVKFWKNKKEYGWIKKIDSLLHAAQEKSKKQKITFNEEPEHRRTVGFGSFSAVIWILAIGLVIFILVKLFMSEGAFKRPSKMLKTAVEEEEPENISDKDYAQLKKRAYAAGDFRMATRYMFLYTLQYLQQRDMISFSPDKTNSMYLYELPADKRSGFAQLSLYYEYVWYGNAPLRKETFDTIETKFNAFLKS